MGASQSNNSCCIVKIRSKQQQDLSCLCIKLSNQKECKRTAQEMLSVLYMRTGVGDKKSAEATVFETSRSLLCWEKLRQGSSRGTGSIQRAMQINSHCQLVGEILNPSPSTP